jgi:nucleotide-binding universal stress UspA family protein
MHKALVAVDGSSGSLCAVRYVMELVQDGEPLEIHLLNVQAPMHLNVSMFIDARTIMDVHDEESAKALKHARALLDDARIPYTKHVVVGHAAQAIAEWAKKLHCDKVIMGTRGLGTATQLLLGSVSHDAIHLMDPRIPVTLVKANGIRAC